MSHIYLDSHGLKLHIEVHDEAALPEVERILPPGWRPSTEFPEDGHFTLGNGFDGGYDVHVDDATVGSGMEMDVALHVLDSQIRARIALLAHDRFFVHAGVVAVDGRAIALPAPSFAGKTSLVAALVAAGATYYSDEFAVLDPDGLVHPYAKPLSLREKEAPYALTPPGVLGAQSGGGPARLAMIAITKFVPGARWEPRRRDPGVGALAMLANAVPARSRTKETVSAVGRASAGAHVLEGERGDAAETADSLLAALG